MVKVSEDEGDTMGEACMMDELNRDRVSKVTEADMMALMNEIDQKELGTLLTKACVGFPFLGGTPPLHPRPRGMDDVTSCVIFGCFFFFFKEEID